MSKGNTVRARAATGEVVDAVVDAKLDNISGSVSEPNVAELIARFQLDTEALIAGIRKDHQKQIAQLESKAASLEDQWAAARQELAGIRKTIEDALHEMRGGVAEALNSQKQAVAAAQKAADAAAVFDKLKASQPDFYRMVQGVQLDLGKVKDRITNVDGTVSALSRRIDELDRVATDYEETKTTVRGLDPIVGALNKDLIQRRTSGVQTR